MLRGNIDFATIEGISGWAWDEEAPERRLDLDILVDGLKVATLTADVHRPDLQERGIGDGGHSFRHRYLEPLAAAERHVVRICDARSGEDVVPAPAIIDPAQGEAPTLRGYLEYASREEVRGWAWNKATPEKRLELDVLVDGRLAGSVIADIHRSDLKNAGIGDGSHSFRYQLPHVLTACEPHIISVRARGSIDEIERSPATLEPLDIFDEASATRVAGIMSLGGPETSESKIDLLTGELGRLLANASELDATGLRVRVASAVKDLLGGDPSVKVEADGGAIDGHVDEVSLRRIAGWAFDYGRPGIPVGLIVTDNDQLVSRILANQFRKDLEEAGFGGGRHAFEIDLSGGLSPFEDHEIRVRREADGIDLPGSPMRLAATRVLDDRTKSYLSELFAEAKSEDDVKITIDFLAGQAARLMGLIGLFDGRGHERRDYRQFLNRWRRRLPEAEAAVAAHKAPRLILRALIVDDLAPKPDRDAGSNAILSHVQSLQRLGYEVVFAPAAEMRADKLDVSALDAIGVSCAHAPFYMTVEDVMAGQAGEFDVVYLHRVNNARKYAELARTYCPKARLIYSVADLYHIRLARQAQAQDRPELEVLSQRMKRAELLAAASADAVITHSAVEAETLRKHLPAEKIHVIAWSVEPRPISAPFAARNGVAFIGGYGHQPNLDAAHWLISEIMPIVRKRDPSIKCLLVGSAMPEDLKRLCRDGIEAVGYVENLADVFSRVRLTIAPLAFGAGVKGKVLESLAAGLPCVCTPIAAEGIELPELLQNFVAGDAAAMAEAILRLHTDETLNAACSSSGLFFINDYFSAQRLDTNMKTAIGAGPKGLPANR